MNVLIRTIAVGIVLPSSAMAQNPISNGGFELPAIATSSRQVQNPTSWSGGNLNTIVNSNGSVTTLPFPQEGQQYIGVATSQSLFQSFTVSSGGQYFLKWFDNAGNETGAGLAPYSVTVTSSSSQQVVGSGSFQAFHPTAWAQRSISMNLVPGNYQLSFAAAGSSPGGLSPLLDNVSVVIPEPSSLSLSLLLAGLLMGRRTGRRGGPPSSA